MGAEPAFVDSNIWLYALVEADDRDPRRVQARSLLLALQRPVISAQVMREVSVNLLRKAGVGESALAELVRSWYVSCQVVETDHEQLAAAARLRQQMSISFWDSLIVAAALQGGCATLYTEDLQAGLVIEGRLTVRNPFVAPA